MQIIYLPSIKWSGNLARVFVAKHKLAQSNTILKTDAPGQLEQIILDFQANK